MSARAEAVTQPRELTSARPADAARGSARPVPLRLAGVLAAGGGLLAGLPLWLWWALEGSGYAPSVWLAGIPYLAAATLLLAIAVPRPALGGARALVLGAFAALAAWTWVAIAWSPDPGAGALEALRRSLYLAAFALPVLWPPSSAGLRVGAWAFVGCAALGVGAGIAGAFGGGLIDGRLAEPALYPNAMAALGTMGALAALVLAARPGASPAAGAGAAGAAGALGAAALLAQSRGGALATVVVVLALLALVPFRVRLLPFVAALAAGITLCSGPLLGVRTAALAGDADGALLEALAAIFALAAALASGTLAVRALARARGERPRRRWNVRLPVRGRVLAAGAAVLMVAVAGAFAASGHGRAWIGERIDDFGEADYTRVNEANSRFAAGLGSNRSDYWRVSLDSLEAQPLAGSGAGSFRTEYLRERESTSSPRYAHGLLFATAGELGAVGLVLLLALAVAAAFALRAALRGARPGDAAVRVAAIVPLAYLLAHATADWVGAFAALAVPALALAGAAVSPAGDGAIANRAPWGSRPGRRSLAFAGVALALAALAVPALVAERLTEWGVATRSEQPGAALDALDAAAGLNPLSATPMLAAGVGCVERGDVACARERFAAAAERAPADWFAALELGLLAREDGDRAAATLWLERAARLNPREPLVREALGEPGLSARDAANEVLAGRSAEAGR